MRRNDAVKGPILSHPIPLNVHIARIVPYHDHWAIEMSRRRPRVARRTGQTSLPGEKFSHVPWRVIISHLLWTVRSVTPCAGSKSSATQQFSICSMCRDGILPCQNENRCKQRVRQRVRQRSSAASSAAVIARFSLNDRSPVTFSSPGTLSPATEKGSWRF